MTAVSRKVQQTSQGQLTVTIPKGLAAVHDIIKGTVLLFDQINRQQIRNDEIDIDDIIFIVKKEKQ